MLKPFGTGYRFPDKPVESIGSLIGGVPAISWSVGHLQIAVWLCLKIGYRPPKEIITGSSFNHQSPLMGMFVYF